MRLVFVIAALLLICAAVSIHGTESSEYDTYSSIQTRAPIDDSASEMRKVGYRHKRTDLSGNKLSKRICAWREDEGKCDGQGYFEFLMKQLIPGIIFALITLIAIPVFWIGTRCWCFWENGIWGGRKASKGFFRTDKDSFRGYTKLHCWIVVIITILSILFVIAFSTLGLAGQRFTEEGLNEFRDGVLDLSDELLTNVTFIESTLLSLNYSGPGLAEITNVKNDIDDINNELKDINEKIDDYDDARRIVTNVFFVLFLFTGFAALLLTIFQFHTTMLTVCVLSLIWSLLAWLFWSAFIIGGYAAVDACHELRLTANANYTGPLDVVTEQCYNNNQFENLLNGVETSMDEALDALCSNFTALCTNGGDYCTSNCSDVSQLSELGNNTVFFDGANTTIAECALNCVDQSAQDLSRLVVVLANETNTYVGMIDAVVVPLAECSYLVTLSTTLARPICTKVMGGAWWQWISSLLLGFGFWWFFVMTTMARKRLKNKNILGHPKNHRGDKHADRYIRKK